MITITVASYNGAPLAQPLAAHFDEMGGNIGRADNNQLVLPDPERTISRVHAQVVFRGGRYAIVDRGSNPIAVNGRPLGNGQEALLQPGDEIAIGGYVMRVEAGGAAQGAPAADPFADFAGLAATGSAALHAPAAPPAAGGFADPLAGFGMAPVPPSAPARGAGAPAAAPMGGIPDDWDPFAPDPSPAKPGPADFARSLGQPGGGGNFGLDIGGRAAPLIPDLPAHGAGGGDSLDNLFGLGPAGASGDPLAGSPLHQAAAQPNMAAHADPLKSLNAITRGSAQAAPDQARELNTPFSLPPMMVPGSSPPAMRPGAQPVPAPTRPTAPPAPSTSAPVAPPLSAPATATPKGAVVSWDEPSGESRTVIRPKSAQASRSSVDPLDLSFGGIAPGAAPFDAPLPGMAPAASASRGMGAAPIGAAPMGGAPIGSAPVGVQPMGAPPIAPGAMPGMSPTAAMHPMPTVPPAATMGPGAFAPTTRPGVAAPMAGSADAAALVAALREGLGAANLPPEALVLTPQLMHLLGRLVHEAVRGTVDLLVARAALKREIRAEVTMIVSRENNPLKFSPSVDVALHHLLMPPARGFMASDRAMRDAYDDLRAHQFGFLAGMRAALEGVLKRFDPAVLESKLTQKSVLASILPAARKARLWEVFQELYTQISAEASDDFHELFGKEFLRAYEEYIDQLSKDRG